MQEGELPLGRDHEQAVGLGHGARHLREELGPRDPDGDRQAHVLADLAAQARGDVTRGARDPPHPVNVEERLVDREALDARRGLPEDLERRLARLRIGRHARRDDYGVRAQPAGLRSAHRGTHAVCLRLVARRKDHAAPDDDGAAAKATVVALLDGGVEGVEVGVEDGGVVSHCFSNTCSHRPPTERPGSCAAARD